MGDLSLGRYVLQLVSVKVFIGQIGFIFNGALYYNVKSNWVAKFIHDIMNTFDIAIAADSIMSI